MNTQTPLSVQFIPTGKQRVRLVLQLSEHYVLYGEYRNGVLRDITLVKRPQTEAGEK